ncbi:GNAT family N-acetyltransferase [Candidatus Eisenbacteria bacterium]|uniref:GNAT family N-acetyltransferase n=1 Tax=Eiseniibacteriota bacterium TaxID=2212470 RepID=A0ABV6YIS7_UNCEI
MSASYEQRPGRIVGAIQIRAMTVEDFEQVEALWMRTEGVGLSPSDSRQGVARFLKRNPDLSFVAEDIDGHVVGVVLCGHDGVRGYLRHLAVAAEVRRRGVGSMLVAHCLERLRTLDIHKCTIFHFGSNQLGQRFWIDTGWKERTDLRILQVVLT